MKLLEVFWLDYETVPKTLGYRIINKLAKLEDQEEALTNPRWAYLFALNIPGADIREVMEKKIRVIINEGEEVEVTLAEARRKVEILKIFAKTNISEYDRKIALARAFQFERAIYDEEIQGDIRHTEDGDK